MQVLPILLPMFGCGKQPGAPLLLHHGCPSHATHFTSRTAYSRVQRVAAWEEANRFSCDAVAPLRERQIEQEEEEEFNKAEAIAHPKAYPPRDCRRFGSSS